jgi:hypothetical protein
MKKIYYLLAFVVAAATFSACKPLSKTYDTLGDVPGPVIPVVIAPTNISYTLVAADYSNLPATNDANLQQFFHGTADAFASIPAILAKKFPNVGEKSTVNVTYATSPVVPAITLADKTNANVSITLQTGNTPSDYKFSPNFTYNPAVGVPITVTAVTFEDLSAAQALSWLRNRYKTLVTPANTTAIPPTLAVYKPATTLANNTLVVLTYLYFESNVTASSGTLATDAFLYTTANDWQKIYRVSNAQYASVNRGTNNLFVAADAPNIPSYINTFLKSDAAIMLTAKVGDVQYVNYKLGTSTLFTQEVMALVYDGVNWVTTNTTLTNIFTYANGIWTGQLDNTVNYSLSSANYTSLYTYATTNNIGSTAARGNFATHPNFAIAAGSAGVTAPTDEGVRWKDTEIAALLKTILVAQFTSPVANQKFVVGAVVFGGYPSGTSLNFNFVYNGTTSTFDYVPVADKAKYTLTGDDITSIARGGIGSAGASLNLNQFGDFESRAGQANLWSPDQIAAGINTVLKSRYSTANGTAPTANQIVAVSYPIYNGANTLVTKNYKFDGTNWIAQ